MYEIFARFFLIAFLNSPCYETPKNAIKKNRTKQPRGKKKKTDGKKRHIFCDEPWCCQMIFSDIFFFRAFELPLALGPWQGPWYETPKKRVKAVDKNKNKNKNRCQQLLFFERGRKCTSLPSFVLTPPPLGLGARQRASFARRAPLHD
jgi:hypothetical protein